MSASASPVIDRSVGMPTARLLLLVAVVAVAIRLAAVFLFDTRHVDPARDHWAFGFEAGRIARELVEGRGFASPFPEPSGPTGWLAPAYPWLLSLLFRVFGVYTAAAGLAAFVLNGLISAATCVVLYRLGVRLYDARVGLLSAGLFAVLPSSVWHASGTIWDTTLSAFVLSAMVLLLTRLVRRPSLSDAAGTAVMAGIAALVNPACLGVYVPVVAWIYLSDWKRLRPRIREMALLAVMPFLICLPWLIRNHVVLGTFALKTNLGLEMFLGNNEDAYKSARAEYYGHHPTISPKQFALYKALGEVAYCDASGRAAAEFIRGAPARFAELVGRRIAIFWLGEATNDWKGNLRTAINLSVGKRLAMAGLALASLLGALAGFRPRDHAVLLIAMLVYPLPFYLTHVSNRYRFPIEPLMVVFTAHLCVLVWSGWQRRRMERAG